MLVLTNSVSNRVLFASQRNAGVVMDSQQLRGDVAPEVYAYMCIESPASKTDAELLRHWVWRGIQADLNRRRELTGENISTSEALANALDRYAEHGELGAEIDE